VLFPIDESNGWGGWRRGKAAERLELGTFGDATVAGTDGKKDHWRWLEREGDLIGGPPTYMKKSQGSQRRPVEGEIKAGERSVSHLHYSGRPNETSVLKPMPKEELSS